MKFPTHIHLLPRLGMSRSIHLHFVYAFVVWREAKSCVGLIINMQQAVDIPTTSPDLQIVACLQWTDWHEEGGVAMIVVYPIHSELTRFYCYWENDLVFCAHCLLSWKYPFVLSCFTWICCRIIGSVMCMFFLKTNFDQFAINIVSVETLKYF